MDLILCCFNFMTKGTVIFLVKTGETLKGGRDPECKMDFLQEGRSGYFRPIRNPLVPMDDSFPVWDTFCSKT